MARGKNIQLSYTGKVESRKLTIHARATFVQEVGAVFDGMEVEVIVKPLQLQRSQRQNRYYWGCIIGIIRDALREHHGQVYEPQEIHEFLKGKFLSTPVVNENTAEVVFIASSTTKLATWEMEEYHEKIRNWAMDFLDIKIPLPNSQRQIDFK